MKTKKEILDRIKIIRKMSNEDVSILQITAHRFEISTLVWVLSDTKKEKKK